MSTKLRIGLILQGNSSWMGGVEYSKNLIKALYALPPAAQSEFELVPLCARRIEQDNYRDMPARFRSELLQDVAPPIPAFWRRIARRLVPGFASMTFLERIRERGVQFVYPYVRMPNERSVIGTAAWIPDFQYKHLPQFYRPEEIEQRDMQHAEVAHCTPVVVLSSQAASKDFRQFFPSSRARIEVLPFRTMAPDGWYEGDPRTTAAKYNLPERFFIVCNQFWQHKNHRIAFEALAQLKRQKLRAEVVCTGALVDHRRPEYAEEVKRMLDELGVREQVHLVGLIPRQDQIQLMRRALAVIQPSLFEGWSTVVEDARVLAKPLAVSNLEVHREQNPPHARFFDPSSSSDLASTLACWWRELSPGPHIDAEREARAENRHQVEAFAQRFLQIARAGQAA